MRAHNTQRLPFVDEILAGLKDARRRALGVALDEIETRIDEVFPAENFGRLLDTGLDWNDESAP